MEREYISPQQVADITGLAVKSIYNRHSNGQMPPAYKFGSRVRWLSTDIEAWLEGHRA